MGSRVKNIVLVSGGMDSVVTAALAMKDGASAFLHANYGQRTEKKELECFHGIADFYGVTSRLVCDVGYLKTIGGSALTDESVDVPTGGLKEGVPITYVPFRNAHLLSIAVSWAETLGAKAIYMGVVEEDGSGYPDCREEFIRAFEKALRLGTRPETDIRIIAPLVHMKKSEIVRRGNELGAPFHLTWSCYKDDALACGECDSCRLRLKGFGEAGVMDPIPYRAMS